MDKLTSKNDRSAIRALEEFLAKRIADMSSADWKATPKERQAEFLKAARRAVTGFRKFDSMSEKRQERGDAKRQQVEAKRRERKEQALKARKAAAEGKAGEK